VNLHEVPDVADDVLVAEVPLEHPVTGDQQPVVAAPSQSLSWAGDRFVQMTRGKNDKTESLQYQKKQGFTIFLCTLNQQPEFTGSRIVQRRRKLSRNSFPFFDKDSDKDL